MSVGHAVMHGASVTEITPSPPLRRTKRLVQHPAEGANPKTARCRHQRPAFRQRPPVSERIFCEHFFIPAVTIYSETLHGRFFINVVKLFHCCEISCADARLFGNLRAKTLDLVLFWAPNQRCDAKRLSTPSALRRWLRFKVLDEPRCRDNVGRTNTGVNGAWRTGTVKWFNLQRDMALSRLMAAARISCSISAVERAWPDRGLPNNQKV